MTRIKWIDRRRFRKRLVRWVDGRLASDPQFVGYGFISNWLAASGFNDMKIAVRQCDYEKLCDLSWAKDEIVIFRNF